MKKKVLALILAAILLLACLTGCSKNNANTNPGEPSNSNGNKGDSNDKNKESTSDFDTEYSYVPNYLPMTVSGAEVQWIQSLCVNKDAVYFMAEVVTGTATDEWTDENGETHSYSYETYDTRLFRMDVNGGEATLLDSYQTTTYPEGVEGYGYVQGMIPMDDGSLWILEGCNITIYDLPEDFDEQTMERWDYYAGEERSLRMVHLDAQGAILEDSKMDFDENEYVYSFLMDSRGYLYASDYEQVFVYQTDGTKVGTIAESGDLFQLGKDMVCLSIWGEEGREVKPIDPEALTLGEPIKLSSRAYNFMQGFGDYDYLYDYNGTIYGHNAQTDAEERLLSWIDCDVNSNNVQNFTFLPDGRVFAVEQNYDEVNMKQNYSIILMDRVLTSTLPQKTEIVYACMYLDWDLRSRIVDFNRSHNDIRIVVHDYSEFNTDEDYQAGFTKLNAEILGGQIPDILSLDELPVSRYAAKGILMDLWPLIDADPSLGRENVMTNVFDAMSIDGKLYQICPNFTIETVLGNSEIVGDGSSWTLQELIDAKAQMDETATIFGEYDTKAGILSNCINRNLGAFVDWQNGKCNFDSQEFIDMLKFADSFPKEFDWENYDYDMPYESDISKMRSGKQMLMGCYLYSLDNFQQQRLIFGENTNFIGYPTTQGNGSSFSVYNTIGMSAACKNVDAAWSFVREILLEENQTTQYMYQFPTNRKSFDAYAKQAMTPMYEENENGEQVEIPKNYFWVDDNTTIEIYALTQAEYDAFMELYNSIHTVTSYDQAIMEIIDNETAAFFDGTKTAEETARMVQSRASLYVAEQS